MKWDQAKLGLVRTDPVLVLMVEVMLLLLLEMMLLGNLRLQAVEPWGRSAAGPRHRVAVGGYGIAVRGHRVPGCRHRVAVGRYHSGGGRTLMVMVMQAAQLGMIAVPM